MFKYVRRYWYFALAACLLLRLKNRRDGELLELFLLLWGLTQALLESLRSDDHMVYHFVRIQQVLAIVLPVAVMLRWTVRAHRNGARALSLSVAWCAVLLAIASAVLAEFGVDRWGNPLLAYGVMILCLIVVGLAAFFIRRRTQNA